MRPFKLIFQHHLSIDLKRFAALPAGFHVESFLHGVGSLQSFRFKSAVGFLMDCTRNPGPRGWPRLLYQS